jgi:DNA-binding NtrC family response regulator
MAELSDDTARELREDSPVDRTALSLVGVLPGDQTRIPRGPGSVLLGRGPKSDVKLDFAEVSREHAVIGCEGSAWILRDLNSTNGVYIDGRRVRSGALRLGAVVRLGGWLGVVENSSEGEPEHGCRELAPGLVGGRRVQRDLEPLRLAAASTLPIVLIGATGTGKERFAKAIHEWSGRPGPLHAVNCAALPAELAESELFGHERGAFTGAELRTRGHFRAADGGTLFFDEIQELPSTLQAKILRAVEREEVIPVGDTRAVAYDARIVVASQRSLHELATAGRFREDLAMRLSGLTVSVPSLGERLADIPTLFEYFLKQHASGNLPLVEARFYERLCLYAWPGNVRELELLARRMLVLHSEGPLLSAMLPAEFGAVSAENDSTRLRFDSRDEEDRHVLRTALEQTGGNMKRAAELANISRARAYRLMGKDTSAESSLE